VTFFEDFRITKHKCLETKKFGYWVQLQDRRPNVQRQGSKARKNFILQIETFLGPIGSRWQYSRHSNDIYILKLENEIDLTLLLLRAQ